MSEFRQDPISGDWILMAPERMKRPHELFTGKKPKRVPAPIENCPFEDLQKSGNWPPIFAWPNEKNWKIVVLPNKYPALVSKNLCTPIFPEGPYKVAQGVGHHELVIGRDHFKNFAKLSLNDAVRVLEVIQSRYKVLSRDENVGYIVGLFNWGSGAGASLYHPHYQILALPITPPGRRHSLENSQRYFEKNKKCPQCVELQFEKKTKTRIIAENDAAIALAPFASVNRFEVRIYPKKHRSSFESATPSEIRSITEMIRLVLQRMEKRWEDPDLNFYIHSVPAKKKDCQKFYHWHIEIVPRNMLPPEGGFELGTHIDINSADPDMVAKMLR